jgi:hypothetical protein
VYELTCGSAAGASLSVTELRRRGMDAGMIWRPILGRRHEYYMHTICDSAASSPRPTTRDQEMLRTVALIPFNYRVETQIFVSAFFEAPCAQYRH